MQCDPFFAGSYKKLLKCTAGFFLLSQPVTETGMISQIGLMHPDDVFMIKFIETT